MLQPSQLRDVGLRFPAEIAELRTFLTDAGVRVQTAEALSDVAAWLPNDHAFRRDLRSHLWVVIDGSGGSMSHRDLLGVLAIAAAGEGVAAETDEEDAKDLLRFVMEVRRSLGVDAGTKPARPVSYRSLQGDGDTVLRVVPAPAKAYRKPAVWAVAAVVLFAVLGGGWWLTHREAVVGTGAPVVDSRPALGRSAEDVSVSESASVPVGGGVAGGASRADGRASVGPSVGVRGGLRGSAPLAAGRMGAVVSASGRVPDGAAVVAGPVAASQPAGPVAPSVASVAAPAAAAPVAPAGKPSAVGVARPAASGLLAFLFSRRAPVETKPAPQPVAADTLSKQLGSPSLPVYAPGELDANGRRYPKLLHRQGATAQDEQVAEVEMPAVPGRGAGAARVAGVVHASAEGMMAANVSYSPVPAYPAAAVAARVQGVVKVQAAVDRDGSVATVRVVSGPPALRDAAMDAVQRWHFKPYLANGKPASANAMAIVEFELP